MRNSQFLKVIAVLIFLPWLMGAAGCPNAFSTLGSKTSDEALLFQAQMDANAKNWTDGITAINQMSATGLAARSTKVTLASLYAGRCGFDLMTVASDLSSMGTTKLLPFLLSTFKGSTTANAADCKLAEQTMFSITTTFANFTTDEDVLLALIEMAKIGTMLAQSGLDAADLNGVLDAAFPIKPAQNATYCASNATPSTTVLADSEVQEIGTGIMIMSNSLSASGTSVGSSVTSLFSSLCKTIAAAPYNLTNFCTTIVASDFDATDVKLLRSLYRSDEIGFDQCGGSISTAACVCP